MKTFRFISLCALAASFSTPGYAQTAGSFFVTAGWFHFAPQDRSDPLKLLSVGGSPVNITFPNTGAGVSSADTAGFTAGYFVTDHIAAEFEFGIPPKFDLSGTGSLAQFGTIGSIKQWSPTLLFKYFFLDANAKFRPYVGIGVTRTSFSDAKITNAAFQAAALGGPDERRGQHCLGTGVQRRLYLCVHRTLVRGIFSVLHSNEHDGYFHH